MNNVGNEAKDLSPFIFGCSGSKKSIALYIVKYIIIDEINVINIFFTKDINTYFIFSSDYIESRNGKI